MRPHVILRICIVLEWVFVITGIVLSFMLEQYLPPPLRTWLEAEAENDLTANDVFILLVGVPLILVMVASTVGLLLLQRWAAWLYLAGTVIGLMLLPFSGPTVEHPLAGSMVEMGTLLTGMVIALAFFSDALKRKDELSQRGGIS